MTDCSKHVGLDVHADTIEVAVAAGSSAVERFGRIANRADAVAKLVGRLSPHGELLCFWYEAGPTGYELYRQLTLLGHDCHVVAPSLIPRKPGERIKTDRRDALMLAQRGRSGDLTDVWVPDEQQEAVRDLVRCRAAAKDAQRRARQHLSSFLLRHGRAYDQGRKRWTKMYWRWLAGQKFAQPVQQIVFQEYVDAVREASDRVDALTRQLQETARAWSLWRLIEALMALRGVNLLTAVTLVAELGDLSRFRTPRQLMAYLGLIPSQYQSGSTCRRGGITKTGNRHVRWVLIEASWCYRYAARKTRHTECKARQASQAVQAIAWKGQKRLCGRYQHLIHKGKPPTQVVTAVARELSGFIWAIAQQVNVRPGTGSRCAESSPDL